MQRSDHLRFAQPAAGRWSLDFGPSVTTIPDLRSLFLVAASVAVLAQLAVLRSVLLGRAPASTPGRSARLAEIAWVLLPTIALVVVLWVTWSRMGAEIALEPSSGIPV